MIGLGVELIEALDTGFKYPGDTLLTVALRLNGTKTDVLGVDIYLTG